MGFGGVGPQFVCSCPDEQVFFRHWDSAEFSDRESVPFWADETFVTTLSLTNRDEIVSSGGGRNK